MRVWPWSAIAELRGRVELLEKENVIYLRAAADSAYSYTCGVSVRDAVCVLARDLRWHAGSPDYITTKSEEAHGAETRG